MRNLLFVLSVATSATAFGQITVDTTRTTVTVKEKVQNVTKTLTIYRTFVPNKGVAHQVVYLPDADYSDEPANLKLSFAAESAHVKKMLDAVPKNKQYNFSRFSINVLPYTDLVNKLVAIYSASKEWNDYLRTAGDLSKTITLFDGNEVKETAFDPKVAMSVLEKSDFIKDINNLFAPRGYKVAIEPFADDHQEVISADQLKAMGKNEGLIIPVPTGFSILKTQ